MLTSSWTESSDHWAFLLSSSNFTNSRNYWDIPFIFLWTWALVLFKKPPNPQVWLRACWPFHMPAQPLCSPQLTLLPPLGQNYTSCFSPSFETSLDRKLLFSIFIYFFNFHVSVFICVCGYIPLMVHTCRPEDSLGYWSLLLHPADKKLSNTCFCLVLPAWRQPLYI